MSAPAAPVPNPTGRAFPVDMAAVKRLGVDEWRAAYEWPVHWHDFAVFCDSLYSGLEMAFRSVGERDRETLVVGGDFIAQIREVLHAAAVEAWAAARGRTLDMEPATRWPYEPDFNAWRLPFGPLATGKAGLRLKGVARGWIENKPLGAFGRLQGALGGTSVWSLGTMGGMKRQGIEAEQRPVSTVYAEALIDEAARNATPRASRPLDDALDVFRSQLSIVVAEHLGRGLDRPAFPLDQLLSIWKVRLAAISGLIDELRRSVKSPPERLHLNEVWKSAHRLVSVALRGMGTDIVAYNHGNDPLHVIQPQHAYLAFGHVTEYVCETEASAAAMDEYYRRSVVSQAFPVRFRSAGRDDLKKVFDASKPSRRSNPAKVMVIGYPFHPLRPQFDVTCFFAFHLEAELRMLELLKRCGFHTIYKAHPESRAEVEGVHSRIADEVSFAPFEAEVERADVIVFLTTVSSTFGHAVCTRKPVVVLDHEGKAWNPRFKNLFARRCRLVPSRLDDANRIAFDETALLAALSPDAPEPDFSIVDEVFADGGRDASRTSP